MAGSDPHPGSQAAAGLPDPAVLLRTTDWAGLTHARGPARDTPAALAALLDPDPLTRARALDACWEPLRQENTIYPATLPAALYIAAILPDPRTSAAGQHGRWGRSPRLRPLRAALLDWLGELGTDADDETAALFARSHVLEDCPPFSTVRALRPVFFTAVAAFLHDADRDVRHAAVAAAIPFAQAPELDAHQAEFIHCARRLLATSTDTYYRARTTDALISRGVIPGPQSVTPVKPEISLAELPF